MPEPPVAADFYKPFNVEVDFFPEFAFHMILLIDYFSQLIDFGFGKVFNSCFRRDSGLGQYFNAIRRPDAKNVLQRDPCLLIYRYVYSSDTWHISSLLSLPLFMLGVIANNPDDAAAFHDFALFTSYFNGCFNFHNTKPFFYLSR
jgi:hypothetical protein